MKFEACFFYFRVINLANIFRMMKISTDGFWYSFFFSLASSDRKWLEVVSGSDMATTGNNHESMVVGKACYPRLVRKFLP